MKKNISFLIFIIAATGVCLFNCTSALTKEYIVKPKSEMQLLSICKTSMSPYIPELGIYMVADISDIDPSMYEFIEEDAQVELFDTYDYSKAVSQEEYKITGIESTR